MVTEAGRIGLTRIGSVLEIAGEPLTQAALEVITTHTASPSVRDDELKVLLLLPAKPTRVVTRELLYTAVTRSRSGVTIIGGSEVLEAAIASPTRRYSGLIARLSEARGQGSRPSSD